MERCESAPLHPRDLGTLPLDSLQVEQLFSSKEGRASIGNELALRLLVRFFILARVVLDFIGQRLAHSVGNGKGGESGFNERNVPDGTHSLLVWL